MARFHAAQYLTSCSGCGARTSKSYARQHDGKCKACTTGEPAEHRGPKCPQCGGPNSSYNARRHYVCSGCTRANDPEGYRREVMGLNDFGGY